MNALYLSYDGITDPLGQSQVLPYIIGLSKKGYHFHIISFEKSKYFESGRDEIVAKIANLSINWYPQQYHKRPLVISTLFDLRKMYRLSEELIKQYQIKLIHCRSYPPGLIGLKLKKKFGVKFLFDIRGFWANERVDGGIWNLSNPVYQTIFNYFKSKEIEMMSGADHIISLTHAGKEEIVSGNLFNKNATGIDPKKITVIPCAVDLDLFDPKKIVEQDRQNLLVNLGLDKTSHILIYLGSLGTWYMLDDMLLYFKKYLSENPKSKFLFVTQDQPEMIWSACKRLGLAREQIILTSSSRDQVPLYLSIATLGIFFIKPTYSKKASSATKMGEMLAMGLPIVSNTGVGDMEYQLKNLNGCILIEMDSEHKNHLLPSISDNTHNITEEYQEVVKSFSLKHSLLRYSAVYNSMK